MTEKYTPEKVAELVATARKVWPALHRAPGSRAFLDLLADVLESVSAERDAAIRDLDAGFAESDHLSAKYYQRMRDAEREMHARELHHFEEEQARIHAEARESAWRADRDRLHRAITEEIEYLEGFRPDHAEHIMLLTGKSLDRLRAALDKEGKTEK